MKDKRNIFTWRNISIAATAIAATAIPIFEFISEKSENGRKFSNIYYAHVEKIDRSILREYDPETLFELANEFDARANNLDNEDKLASANSAIFSYQKYLNLINKEIEVEKTAIAIASIAFLKEKYGIENNSDDAYDDAISLASDNINVAVSLGHFFYKKADPCQLPFCADSGEGDSKFYNLSLTVLESYDNDGDNIQMPFSVELEYRKGLAHQALDKMKEAEWNYYWAANTLDRREGSHLYQGRAFFALYALYAKEYKDKESATAYLKQAISTYKEGIEETDYKDVEVLSDENNIWLHLARAHSELYEMTCEQFHNDEKELALDEAAKMNPNSSASNREYYVALLTTERIVEDFKDFLSEGEISSSGCDAS